MQHQVLHFGGGFHGEKPWKSGGTRSTKVRVNAPKWGCNNHPTAAAAKNVIEQNARPMAAIGSLPQAGALPMAAYGRATASRKAVIRARAEFVDAFPLWFANGLCERLWSRWGRFSWLEGVPLRGYRRRSS